MVCVRCVSINNGGTDLPPEYKKAFPTTHLSGTACQVVELASAAGRQKLQLLLSPGAFDLGQLFSQPLQFCRCYCIVNLRLWRQPHASSQCCIVLASSLLTAC